MESKEAEHSHGAFDPIGGDVFSFHFGKASSRYPDVAKFNVLDMFNIRGSNESNPVKVVETQQLYQ